MRVVRGRQTTLVLERARITRMWLCYGPSRHARARIFLFSSYFVWSAIVPLSGEFLGRVEMFFFFLEKRGVVETYVVVAYPFRPLELTWERAADGNDVRHACYIRHACCSVDLSPGQQKCVLLLSLPFFVRLFFCAWMSVAAAPGPRVVERGVKTALVTRACIERFTKYVEL